MDDKIHIPKEEPEKLEPSFDQLSEERNLREQAEEKLKTIQAELIDRNRELEQLRLVKGSQDAILNNAAYMVISAGCDGIITTFNPAAERNLGYTAEECIGKLSTVVFHEPDELAKRAGIFSAELGVPVSPDFEVFALRARLRLPNEYEWTYIRKDGSRFPVLLSVTVLWDPQGKTIGFMGIANDITGRKQSEAMLLESEAKFSTVFQLSPVALSITSLKNQLFIDVNESFLRNIGYKKEELVGQPTNFLDLWVDHERRDNFRHLIAEQGKVDNYEFEFQGKKGKRGYGLVSAAVIEINNEPCVLSQITIITERKAMVEALKRSEARLNEAQHIAHIGSWELDIVNNRLMWSDEIYRIFEIDPEKFDASYEAFLNAIHPDDRDLVNKAYTDSLKNKAPYDIVHRLQMPDGQIKYVNEKCETYYGNDDMPLRSVGTVHDITGIKLAEKAQQRLNRELQAISNCNQVLMRAVDEQTLLNDICQIICNEAGYRMAWVGFAEHDQIMSLRAVAHAGAENGYLETTHFVWADEECGRGPSGIAIRTGESACFQDFATDAGAAPWRESALQRGYRSSIALPLKDENAKVYGVLNIYSTEPNAFTPDEIRLLEELAGDLSFGITVLRSRIVSKLSEQKIMQLAAIVESSNDAITGKTLGGIVTSWNKGAENIYGYTEDEMLGNSISILVQTESEDEVPMILEKIKAGEHIEHFETLRQRKDGQLIHVSLTISPVLDEHGIIIGASTIGRDITERKRNDAVNASRLHLMQFAVTHTLDELLEETLNEAEQLSGSHIGFYHFVDDDQNTLTLQEWSTETKAKFCKAEAKGLHYAISDAGVWVDCVHQRKPVIHNNYASLTHRKGMPEGHAEIIRELVVPVFRGEKIKAILGVGNKNTDYVEKDMEAISLLADLAWEIAERKQAEDALRESEEKYRTLIQKIQAAVVVHGTDTRIISCNVKAQELLGLSEDQLLGKTAIDPDWHFYRENTPILPIEEYPVNLVMATRQELRNYIVGIHRPNNENDLWVLIHADPVFGKEGEIAQVIVTFIDITERKQAEEELEKYRDHLEALVAERTKQLQESEFYYRRLFETMFQGVVYQDAEGRVISMNPAAELILGRTQSEFSGKTSVDTENQLFREDGSRFSAEEHPAMVALSTGQEVRDVVMKLYDPKEDKYRWININAMPLSHQGETKPYQVYSLFSDITEQKAAEKILRESEERMRLFFERQLVGMAITSPEKGWIKVNDKICEMLGYPSEELTQMTWSEMTYPEDLAPDVLQFERLLRDEIDGYTLEKRFVRKDGSIVFTNLAVGCVRRPDRSVDYVLAILEDITGRKLAEDQIRRLNEQLAARALSLEQANKELEAFSYSVSHDLRAPLRGIDGFSLALLDEYHDKLDEQGKLYLSRVRSASQRMAQLIDDMLNLSRVSRGEMNIMKVNLSKLALEIAEEFQETQPERKAEFIIQEGIEVHGDGHLLRIVLENLIGNSWKFTSKHATARIEFGMLLKNGRPVYFVRDDGAGFDMNYAQKLFGAFQRLHTVTEFQGTGVGLATVQRVVLRHGGKVWAESGVEKGTTIYFTIV